MSSGCRAGLAHLRGVLVAALLAAGLAACGSDGDDGKDPGRANGQTQAAEKAFLTGMVAHHQSGIEMAEVAEQRGKDPFIKGLAGDISSTQEREIAQMEEIYKRLFDGGLRPDPSGHDALGLTAQEAGMTHSADASETLRRANPFDRAFVDDMVPHHRGAVAMSKVLLDKSEDAALRKLAEAIISTQRREIEEMNDFRAANYGGPVPKGTTHGAEPEGETRDGRGHHPG